MERAVRDWVRRDPAGYGYLLDFYRRGARVCYAGEDGLVLKNEEFDICYAGGTASSPELEAGRLVLVEDRALAERLAARDAGLGIMECRQCMYLREDPPRAECDAEGVLGAEVGGRLAGFIGIHEEGAMGLLEVLPQFRRRGLAEALEAALIGRQLGKGALPYAQVRIGNTASEALQEKLGLTFDRRVLYWIG